MPFAMKCRRKIPQAEYLIPKKQKTIHWLYSGGGIQIRTHLLLTALLHRMSCETFKMPWEENSEQLAGVYCKVI